jgi:hypothetical protein
MIAGKNLIGNFLFVEKSIGKKKINGFTDRQCVQKQIYLLEYTNEIIPSVIGSGI